MTPKIDSEINPNTRKNVARPRANSGPTDETFLQRGHLANAFVKVLNRNSSEQCRHVTLHMPGVGAGGVLGVPKFIIRLQLGRGQAILRDDSLHTNKQLQGHLTYFLPAGACLIGEASLQNVHFTTNWSFLSEMLMDFWQTRQVIMFGS